ncbi:MAG: inorganic phosphate transporter [Bryobacterales bacterium]|nr:inorganic phosphate transporter [Bryobacterales bacterium]
MSPDLILLIVIVAAALLFDFFNGFNDAANSIATIVATQVLTPLQAVIWAAFFNFAAFFLFGTSVAKTVGGDMVNLDYVTPLTVLAGLVSSAAWLWISSHLGLPISATHALIGGYAGAAISRVMHVKGPAFALDALRLSGWTLPLIFIVLSPILGMLLSYLLMIVIHWIFRNSSPKKMDKWFRGLQLVSSAVFSLSHGSNDAQKTMGIITGALVAAKVQGSMDDGIPTWVVLAAYTAIALGTASGGWKVIETMGHRITKLKPRSGSDPRESALRRPASCWHEREWCVRRAPADLDHRRAMRVYPAGWTALRRVRAGGRGSTS